MIILTTPVYLTDEQAKEFLLFQKHYDMFKKIDEAKISDVKFGKVTFNIAFGKIQNIVKEEVVYQLPAIN